MALHFRSVQLGRELLLQLDIRIKDKEKWQESENENATKIQTRFRESRARRNFTKQRYHAAKLQRVYRGFVGRTLTKALEAKRRIQKQGLLYAYFAEVVQKFWRGFYSRRNKHDYHARKQYIKQIVDNSEALQKRIQQYAKEAKAEDAKIKAERRKKAFQQKAARMNYLRSTKAQAGIFNGPYMQMPTVDGVPLENAIVVNVRDYLKKNKLDKKKGILKAYPRRNKQSLRQSSKYDVVEEARRRERKFSKMRRVGRKNFLGGTRAPAPVYKRGFQEGCEYIEPRELKKTSKEILDKQKHKRMSDKPFHLATKRGMIFD